MNLQHIGGWIIAQFIVWCSLLEISSSYPYQLALENGQLYSFCPYQKTKSDLKKWVFFEKNDITAYLSI